MSKGNMLLGHARGKVGSLVFSRSNGQQIVRARAEVVKNPRTEKQMIQRIVLNTVSQAYSRMQPIVDHSFEGVQQGLQTMSQFMRTNMKNVRSAIAAGVAANQSYYDIYAFAPAGSNVYAPNDFVVSRGSLPEIEVQRSSTTAAVVSALTVNTYAGVLDAYGLQRGDQLTFIGVDISQKRNGVFHYARVILDPTNEDGTPADLSTPFVTNGAVNLPSPRNNGDFASFSVSASGLSFSFSQMTLAGAAVIVSRQNSDGTWKRSNATMPVFTENVTGFIYSLGEALELSVSGGIDTLSDLYLNNSGTGNLLNTEPAVDVIGGRITGVTIGGTSVAKGGSYEITAAVNAVMNVDDLDADRDYLMGVRNPTTGNINVISTNVSSGSISGQLSSQTDGRLVLCAGTNSSDAVVVEEWCRIVNNGD